MNDPLARRQKRVLSVFIVLSVIVGAFIVFALAYDVVMSRREARMIREVEEVRSNLRDLERSLEESGLANAENSAPVEALKKLGGRLSEDENGNSTALTLTGPQVTNAELVHVKRLTELKKLLLGQTGVNGAGLAQLSGMTNLTSFSVYVAQVSDADLEHLKGLTSLTSLSLNMTRVTDAGLEKLVGLKNLEDLNLQGTGVTDSGLEHLKGLTGLTRLSLARTQVTDEGVAELKKTIPSCRILVGD